MGSRNNIKVRKAWDIILAEVNKEIEQCSNYRELPALKKVSEFLNKATIYCASVNETVVANGEVFVTEDNDWSAVSPFYEGKTNNPIIILKKDELVKNKYNQHYPIYAQFPEEGSSDLANLIFHEALHYISKRSHKDWKDLVDPIYAVSWMCFPRQFAFDESLHFDECVTGLTSVFHKDSGAPIDVGSAMAACSKPRPEYEKSFDAHLRSLMKPMEKDFINYKL